MRTNELAKRIANFIWDLDPYSCRSEYENIGELISRTWSGLSSKRTAKWIREYLLECDTEKEYARELAKEVEKLCLR